MVLYVGECDQNCNQTKAALAIFAERAAWVLWTPDVAAAVVGHRRSEAPPFGSNVVVGPWR
jgi:hypothetical protein